MNMLVFIPAYNCAAHVVRTLAQFTPTVCQTLQTYGAHILVVNNRSTDTTAADAARALAQVNLPSEVITNTENYNLGGSHKVAFAYAQQHGFTHVAVLHGDDQGRITDLLPVLPHAAHTPMVSYLGARFMPGSKLQGYGLARIGGNLGFNALFSLATGRLLYDLGSGLNLFSLQGLAPLNMHRFGDNLMFNYYLILGICHLRLPYRFFPISWREDDQVSNVKLWQHGRRTLALLGQFVRGRTAFLQAEHRSTPHATYSWSSTAVPTSQAHRKAA